MEWLPERITFYIDGANVYETTDRSYIPTTSHDFFAQLTSGVQGGTQGIPVRDVATPNPLNMQIDYLKIFTTAAAPAPTPVPTPPPSPTPTPSPAVGWSLEDSDDFSSGSTPSSSRWTDYDNSTGAAGPITGQWSLWVDPASLAAAHVGDYSDPVQHAGVQHVADTPMSVWAAGNWSGGTVDTGNTTIADAITAANTAGKRVSLSLYWAPIRDNNGASAGGANDWTVYQSWITTVVSPAIGSAHAVIILEADAVPLASVLLPADQTARWAGLSAAIQYLKTHNANVEVYLDVGHSQWLNASQLVPLMLQAGIQYADGFSETSRVTGRRLRSLLGRIRSKRSSSLTVSPVRPGSSTLAATAQTPLLIHRTGRTHPAPCWVQHPCTRPGKTSVDTWQDPKAGKERLDAYATAWVGTRTVKGQPLAPRTRELYESQLRLHIFPRLGKLQLRQIDAATVQAWYASLPPTPSRAKCYRLLRAIFQTAIDDEILVKNPCNIRGGGAETVTERPMIAVGQVEALAEAVPARWKALVLLAAWCGLRLGELSALRKNNLDLDAGTVSVKETASDLAHRRDLRKLKSAAGVREVAIPPHILGDLRSHAETFSEPGRMGLMFVGPRGGAIRRNNFSADVWRPACDKVPGLPEGLHLHDLRGVSATLAARSGGDDQGAYETPWPRDHRHGSETPAGRGGAGPVDSSRHERRPYWHLNGTALETRS